MNCSTTREWLLEAEEPAPAELLAHLNSCSDCRSFRDEVCILEQRWRDRPLPPRAESSKQAFLARWNPPMRPSLPNKPRRDWLKWTVAALLVAGIGGGMLLFWPGEHVDAHPDVLDRLIDWNLEMTEAVTPMERQKIYQTRHEDLRNALKQAKLDNRERDLGERLLANGVWMVDNEDPLEELQRFHQVADDLLVGMKSVAHDPNRSDRMARKFTRVSLRGIDGNLNRIKPEKLVDPEGRVKFNKLLRKDADMTERVRELLERAPDMTKRELRQALELSNKRHKPKKI